MALRPGQAGLACGNRWNPKTTTAPHRGCMCIGDEEMVPWAPSSDCQERTQRSSVCTPYHRCVRQVNDAAGLKPMLKNYRMYGFSITPPRLRAIFLSCLKELDHVSKIQRTLRSS